ncbi:hypothetical protein ElyMa_003501700 [Elysia marginata]|uniref:Uncharacterized protein n=1 Tax=Elysia marginata TaxID=1093978 RepID=A0AAV4EE16_9GAST|nr:hypothetical protein ElyMa_003501700 [Elysia marginata]
MLLCGGFSILLIIKLVWSSHTCRSLLLYRSCTPSSSDSNNSPASQAPRPSVTSAEPPDYLSCTHGGPQGDATTLELGPHDPSQQRVSNNHGGQATSGSLPAYDEIFKDGEVKPNEVAVVSESGEVTFKSYAEAFADSKLREGETGDCDGKSRKRSDSV